MVSSLIFTAPAGSGLRDLHPKTPLLKIRPPSHLHQVDQSAAPATKSELPCSKVLRLIKSATRLLPSMRLLMLKNSNVGLLPSTSSVRPGGLTNIVKASARPMNSSKAKVALHQRLATHKLCNRTLAVGGRWSISSKAIRYQRRCLTI